jgi:membrane protease YdiL (CAAX protease family)
MASPKEQSRRTIPAVALIHQEGAIGVIALVGLFFRPQGLTAALSPNGSLVFSLLIGVGAGGLCAALFWFLRSLPPLAALEAWQRRMVKEWSVADAAAVAVFSGLAEEALVRALLQPIIGLLPAALLFAALHFLPDRRLWLWPVLALVLGVVLGKLFEAGGYPAAAAAHVTINAVSLIRLQRPLEE